MLPWPARVEQGLISPGDEITQVIEYGASQRTPCFSRGTHPTVWDRPQGAYCL